jgi:transglutaminase/protease-like cytokinesis protein 3
MMISLEQIIDAILNNELGYSKFLTKEEFEKYLEEIQNEEMTKTQEELQKEYQKNEKNLIKSYSGSDYPLEAICIYMIRNRMREISKKDFVKVYYYLSFIHHTFMKELVEVKQIISQIDAIKNNILKGEKENVGYY